MSLAARDVGLLEKLSSELAEGGGRELAMECDVTDSEAVDRFAAATLGYFGHVDILVNNAGALAFGSFLDESDEQWDEMLDVNLNSARLVTRAFLPSMLEHGGGKVIFMSSNAAKKGFPNDAGYSVAKAGLMALTKVIAVEYGTQGIETFWVHPGWLRIPTWANRWSSTIFSGPIRWGPPQVLGMGESLSPTGFHPSTQEIVDLVTFLAGPGSTVLTGSCITADHGSHPTRSVTPPTERRTVGQRRGVTVELVYSG